MVHLDLIFAVEHCRLGMLHRVIPDWDELARMPRLRPLLSENAEIMTALVRM